MHSHETLLESFIESIGTIPQEIRRNLAHMRSLDQMYAGIVEELRDCEEDYLKRAYDLISDLEVQSRHEPLNKKQKFENQESDGVSKEPDNKSEDGDGNVSNEGSRKFWSDLKEGIVVKLPQSTADDDDQQGNNVSDEQNEGSTVDLTNRHNHVKNELLIPTTEELRLYIQDPEALLRIAVLRKNAREIVEEKLSNASQTFAIVDDAIKKLDSDLEAFEALLKSTGQYETTVITGAAQPNDLAAIQVTANSPDWILAKVISHDPQTGMYNLSDEDIESNKTFLLPESQVVILGGVDRLNRGDVIYGVYPDTTSFYQATVVEIPKKIPGKDSFVLVHFKDDGDENGITHAKVVPMKHIMRVPYGAMK